jgi:3-hexulose-6-phosphate synthase
MARAHEETIHCVVQAGNDFGVEVMGDNLACPDMVEGAKWLEDLGCDYVIHHIGYDERRGIAARGERMPSPLDQLKEVVNSVNILFRLWADFPWNRRFSVRSTVLHSWF